MYVCIYYLWNIFHSWKYCCLFLLVWDLEVVFEKEVAVGIWTANLNCRAESLSLPFVAALSSYGDDHSCLILLMAQCEGCWNLQLCFPLLFPHIPTLAFPLLLKRSMILLISDSWRMLLPLSGLLCPPWLVNSSLPGSRSSWLGPSVSFSEYTICSLHSVYHR